MQINKIIFLAQSCASLANINFKCKNYKLSIKASLACLNYCLSILIYLQDEVYPDNSDIKDVIVVTKKMIQNITLFTGIQAKPSENDPNLFSFYESKLQSAQYEDLDYKILFNFLSDIIESCITLIYSGID